MRDSEEVDAALVAAEAVNEAVEGSNVVADFRAVAVNAATTTTTTVAVGKDITMEVKACITKAPHKDPTIKATGAATTTCIRPRYSPCNKVA